METDKRFATLENPMRTMQKVSTAADAAITYGLVMLPHTTFEQPCVCDTLDISRIHYRVSSLT